MANVNAQGLTPEEMSKLAEQQMQTRVQNESVANPGTQITGGQTGALPYGQGTTPQTYQAITSSEESRRNSGIQEVARLNGISEQEAAGRYDRGMAGAPKDLPPGTVYNPATGKAYDRLTGNEFAGYVDPKQQPQFAGMRFVEGQQGFQGNGMMDQTSGRPMGASGASGASGSTNVQGADNDPESMMLTQMLQERRQRAQAAQDQMNRQYDNLRREAEARQKSETGQTAMQMARMGAFSSASGVAYGTSLQARQAGELADIENKRIQSLAMARDNASDEELSIAFKQLERAKALKGEQESLAAKHTKELADYEKMRQVEKGDLADTFQGMIDSDMSFEDLPQDYIKTQYPDLDSFTAKTLFATVQKTSEAKTAKTKQEQIKMDYDNASNLVSVLGKVPLGKSFTIGGVEYAGFDRGAIKTGTETDQNGNVTFWSVDPVNKTTSTTSLGSIGKTQDGWDTKFDDNGKPWRFNSSTGQMVPFFPGQAQADWQKKFPEGSTSPFKDANGNPRVQCGAFVNDMTGIGVGDTYESKMAKMNLFKKGQGDVTKVLDQLQIGDVITQKLGTWTGHISMYLGHEIGPDGKPCIRALESNYPQPGKVTSTRLIPMEQIDGIGRGPRVNPALQSGPDSINTVPATTGTGLPASQQDGMPTFGGKKTEQEKPLSISDLEKVNAGLPPEQQLAPGSTMADAAKSGYKPGGYGSQPLKVPAFDEFARGMEQEMAKDPNITMMKPEEMQQIYNRTVGAAPSYVDAAQNVSLKLTGEKKGPAFVRDIQTALEKGDFLRAQDKLKKVSLDTADTVTAQQVRGREDAANALLSIKSDLEQYRKKFGDTGLFTGSMEKIAQKAGQVNNAEQRRIATKIAGTLANYRRSISGAAFTESEGKVYDNMFPSTLNGQELNDANISGLLSLLGNSNETFYRQQMGNENYDAIFGN